MERLIVDTDIFVDMLRGHEAAAEFLVMHRPRIAVSVMTVCELLAGHRSAKEEAIIMEVFAHLNTVPVGDAIAAAAGHLRRRYGKSHGSGLIDCVIAATALEERATLATLNKKHYPMVKRILTPYKKH